MRKILTIATFAFLALLLTVPALAFDMDAKSWYGQGLITLPMGNFGDFAGTGFGVAAGMRVPHDEKITFRGEVGYIMYGGKDFGLYSYTYSMIPIMALAEIQFNPESKAYGVGGLGFNMVRFKSEASIPATALTPAYNVDDTTSSTELTIALGGGMHLNEKWDLEGRYNIISDTSYVSVHANVRF